MLQLEDRFSRQDQPYDGGSNLTNALINEQLITPKDADMALLIAKSSGVGLGEVLVRRMGVAQLTINSILAEIYGAQLINPLEEPPDLELASDYGIWRCLNEEVLPWRQIGGDTIVLCTKPEKFLRIRDGLQSTFGSIRLAITTEEHLQGAITLYWGHQLASAAENRVQAHESCRGWNSRLALGAGLSVGAALITGVSLAPVATYSILLIWALITLTFGTLLKATAAVIGWQTSKAASPINVTAARLPVITVLVPLYKETAIAEHLIARLRDLDYPRELLDVCIVLEANDLTTRDTLGRTTLPRWIRPIAVPEGTIKTKPRALNYALDFARGSIIGVWDAEDAPAADQLRKVAERFAKSPGEVACLQGVLDYYNPGTNWLTRCFSIEYAGWFRVLLPGLQRLGLVIPLGGTTLFFRREILEKLGGWDAHNVTEDADLGVRLARHGYRTELIDTVTEEEANGRAWPWVKQRSRWLKGYAITYLVHMRHPRRLWADLGAWRFFGFQLLFLGTLSQFILAPILWSFWLVVVGVSHPLETVLPSWGFWTLAGLFIFSELVNLTVATIGTIKARKPWLIKWALTLSLYFPLGAMAAYKGLYELASKPFYWDKTAHGVLLPKGWRRSIPPPQPPVRPVSNG